eukprot:6430976-Prorocentrum_lima.AAC.1
MAKNLDMPFLDSALAAVAAGTFIYVGANEVVAEEFEGNGTCSVVQLHRLANSGRLWPSLPG